MEIREDIEVEDLLNRILAEVQKQYMANDRAYLSRTLEDNVAYWMRILKAAKDNITFRTRLYCEIPIAMKDFTEEGKVPTLWDYMDYIQELKCVDERDFTKGLYKD